MSTDIPTGTGRGSLPPVNRMKEEVERWWQSARASGERAMEAVSQLNINPGMLARATSERAMEVFSMFGLRPGVPLVDVYEGPERIHVVVDLPGVHADAVELSLSGNVLKVTAKRWVENAPDLRPVQKERSGERFERTILLPCAVNPESVAAVVTDGVLRVELQRVAQPPERPIPVQKTSRPTGE